MPSYRMEISPNNRATCSNAECKKASVKLLKGEIRWGTLVTIHEHNSWAWRHWGCVTPQVIANVQEFINGDKDLLDGYEELPTEAQAKIDYALEHGHVPDEDWKGDPEVNRPGQKGFRVKTPKKKKGKKDDDEEDDGSPKPKKKRGRATKDDAEEAPAPKKARGKKAAVKAEDDEEAEEEPKPAKKARGKKAAVKEEEDDEGEEEPKPAKKARGKKTAVKADEEGDEKPKPRTGRARKAAVYKEESSGEDAVEEDSEEVEAPKAKRAKKAAVADKEKPAPQKRGRKKKTAADE